MQNVRDIRDIRDIRDVRDEKIIPKRMTHTYLGTKGYTIPKSELTEEQINTIKKELTVRPYTPGISLKDVSEFPAYRESVSKMYVPRYYGIENFGEPVSTKISEGEDISIEFAGTLRDNQVPVVAAYLARVSGGAGGGGGGGLLDLYCAFGKTSLTLKIICDVGKKTIVVVNKEFLLNQWVDRIRQFIPNARVGRVQGSIIDIENKDIVLCMLQSLSMKDYPTSTFDSFGLMVIDEVHHISSEVFSRALFKLVPKYTIGLSATMDRKDGTTKIFKMFLGDVIYKAKRPKDEGVMVRALEYKTNDEDFNKVEYDFRGNAAYSTMISKLCSYSARTEFILRTIRDLMSENPSQQIMVIAHNKNVLKYIHDAIEHRGFASVGYYVGGMKESALKITEGKQIVVASYAMCSEGLDIPTLTTLVMVTPKTEIEQTVGRILRVKHSSPLIVDIVDSHEPFQNQWKKRLSFYKKQGYTVTKGEKKVNTPFCEEDIEDLEDEDDLGEDLTEVREAREAREASQVRHVREEGIGKCLLRIKK
jgi:superfamily II DNA or RNA helicase